MTATGKIDHPFVLPFYKILPSQLIHCQKIETPEKNKIQDFNVQSFEITTLIDTKKLTINNVWLEGRIIKLKTPTPKNPTKETVYLLPEVNLPEKILLKRFDVENFDPKIIKFARILGMVKSNSEVLVLRWSKLETYALKDYKTSCEQAQYNVVSYLK